MSDPLDPRVWWERAMQDYRVAELALQEDASGLAPAICVSCHEACEKMLKAYLLSKGWELVRSHELKALAKEAAKTLPEIKPMFAELMQLNADFVVSRYPNGYEEDAEHMEAHQAFSIAKRLRDLLAARL